MDPGAQLGEAAWAEWLGLGAELREMGEVLPLDPHDWFEVRWAGGGWWGWGLGAGVVGDGWLV